MAVDAHNENEWCVNDRFRNLYALIHNMNVKRGSRKDAIKLIPLQLDDIMLYDNNKNKIKPLTEKELKKIAKNFKKNK